jgi:hypothetical protein
MEELRASGLAAILELTANSDDVAHRRSSLYALMVDANREREGCLRRVVQREEVAFYPKTDSGGAVLHPHVGHPIVPGYFDQHSSGRGTESNNGSSSTTSAVESSSRLNDVLNALPVNTTTPLISDPYWKTAEDVILGSTTETAALNDGSPFPSSSASAFTDDLCCFLCLRPNRARPSVCPTSSHSVLKPLAEAAGEAQQKVSGQ